MGKRRHRRHRAPGTEIGGMPIWALITSVGVIAVFAVIALVNLPQQNAAAGGDQVVRTEFSFGPTAEATPQGPLTLFIGDSYTHGTGASSKSQRWSTLVSQAQGWQEDNEALGGTGYLTTSGVNGCGQEFCPNYVEVIDSLSAELAPATVVIAGGQNDFRTWTADSAPVREAINTVYENARAKFPDARIIAVGPSIIGTVSQNVVAFDQAVQDAAANVGADYVSLIDPDALDPSMDSGDGGHVNDVGHRAIADRVLAALG